jgi:hypothetical protein
MSPDSRSPSTCPARASREESYLSEDSY